MSRSGTSGRPCRPDATRTTRGPAWRSTRPHDYARGRLDRARKSSLSGARWIADCADVAIVPMSLRNRFLCGLRCQSRSAQSKSLARLSGHVIMKSPTRLAHARFVGVAGQAAGMPRSGWASGRPGGLNPRSRGSPIPAAISLPAAGRPGPRTRIVPTILARIPLPGGRSRSKVGTIATSAQSALSRRRLNADYASEVLANTCGTRGRYVRAAKGGIAIVPPPGWMDGAPSPSTYGECFRTTPEGAAADLRPKSGRGRTVGTSVGGPQGRGVNSRDLDQFVS
jgi:hypothetical protein